MTRVLLDENLPFGLRRILDGFEVAHVTEESWDGLSNGRLIVVAEAAGIDVFVTADRNLRHQQSWAGRRMALVVLSTNHWPTIRSARSDIARALAAAQPGSIQEVRLSR